MNVGLYSKYMINTLQTNQLFLQEVNAAHSNIARKMIGYNVMEQGLKMKLLLN